MPHLWYLISRPRLSPPKVSVAMGPATLRAQPAPFTFTRHSPPRQQKVATLRGNRRQPGARHRGCGGPVGTHFRQLSRAPAFVLTRTTLALAVGPHAARI